MNRSTKYNFYLPQNTDLIDPSDFDYNFEIIDENLITESQTFTDTQKSTARTNIGAASAADLGSKSSASSVTGDDAFSKIKTIDDKINDKLDYYTLLNGESVTSNLTNKTLYGSRSLSDYHLILAVVKRGGVMRSSLMTVRGLFTQNTDVISLTEVDSVNTQRWYEIKYVDSTTVSIQCSSNASGNADIYLYGLH